MIEAVRKAALAASEVDGSWLPLRRYEAMAKAIFSTTLEPSEAEIEAATRAHTPVVFMDTTGWDETSAAHQATMKAAALTHMRAALIAAARVRVGG